MRLWLFVLFVIVPVIELAVIIQVGSIIGVWPTIGLLFLTGIVGVWLMRRQGAAALTDLQRAFRELQDPSGPIANGALILLAGALMLAPGFISDITGLALLLPPVRRLLIKAVGSRMAVTRAGFGFPGSGARGPGRGASAAPGDRRDRDPTRPPVIDADFIEVDPASPPPRPGTSGWTRP